MLTKKQIDEFWATGVLVVEKAVTGAHLNALRQDFHQRVEESRDHENNFGEMIDGRARFDLEPGHTSTKSALRRVNAPTDVSDTYAAVARERAMVDMVADLIGPSLRYHHSKFNSKLPGAATQVKRHQDFPFMPHTNSDLVTALLMVDEVTDTNGPLQVMPGSHKGPLYSLWHEGQFQPMCSWLPHNCSKNHILYSNIYST